MYRVTRRRGSRLIGLLLLVSSAALWTSPVSAEAGVWQLVATKRVNGTVSSPGGWQVTVQQLESGNIQFSATYDGNVQTVSVTWTPPPARLVPDREVPMTVSVSNPVIKPFPFPWNHSARATCYIDRFGLAFDRTSGGGIEGPTAEVPVSEGAGAVRSGTRQMKIPQAGFGGEAGKLVLRVSASTSGPLGIEYVYQWIGSGDGPPPPPEESDPNTDNTSWSVGHPVPWVFTADGTVRAQGLWEGTWTRRGNTYTVTIIHMGVKDVFTVEFSPDGRSFVSYKDGQIYRRGVRR